jgi:hypothetical protein
MEKRSAPRKVVLMSGVIELADSALSCLVINMSISGAALEVSNTNIPDRFCLFFKADNTRIPCRVVWRDSERIGVAFD